MDNPKEIIESLHPLERKVLPLLKKYGELNQIVKESGLKEIEVMRALQWLENKKIIVIKKSSREKVEIDSNGKEYAKNGMPEKRILKALEKGSMHITDISGTLGIQQEEVNSCIGVLKSKAAIIIDKINVSITEHGKKLLSKEDLEEKFLKNISDYARYIEDLEPEERLAYQNLSKRKCIIKTVDEKSVRAILTENGKKIADEKISSHEYADRLTPQMLKKGSWKGKSFRKYDVSINVPAVTGGKRHFVSQAIDYIRKIWLEMGFREMSENMVQTAFWDLDALFVPQDHPARQMQDTFYIKDPEKGKIPKSLAKKIKAVHENGGDTGSRGWGGKWSESVASQNLLRTHATVLSAHAINSLKETEIPAKFFSVSKVFRNEALDWKHLFEFYQVEGIVVDPNANMKYLKGYLKEFFAKMGYPDVRIRPAHFPYTEPSAEVDVWHPEKCEWVELGGAGIFRPEMVKPLLGVEVPVLAWGLGMARTISEYFSITDIRDLYRNDLNQIRKMKMWMR